MKLALNGALTIGTDDGANIEIRSASATTTSSSSACWRRRQASARAGYQPLRWYEATRRSKACLDAIAGGFLARDGGATGALVDSLLGAATITRCWPTTRPPGRRRAWTTCSATARHGRRRPSPTSPDGAMFLRTARSANTRRVWGTEPAR